MTGGRSDDDGGRGSGSGTGPPSPRVLVEEFLALSSSSSSSSRKGELARAADRITGALEEGHDDVEASSWAEDDEDGGPLPPLVELIPPLVEHCSMEVGGEGEGGDESSPHYYDGVDLELVSASFRCLLAILRLGRRRALGNCGGGNGGESMAVVGPSLPSLAGSIVAALSLPSPSMTDDEGEGSSQKLRATVLDVVGELTHRPRGDKGRAEMTPASLRDLILLPLLSSENSSPSPRAHEAAAELFARTVVSSAELASSGISPHDDGSSGDATEDEEDELEALQRQIRGETAALGTIQALGSEIFDRILSALPVLCHLEEEGFADDEGLDVSDELRGDVERANASLEAVTMVYGVAPDAVRGRIQEKFGDGTGVEGDGNVTTMLEARFLQLDREREGEARRRGVRRDKSTSGRRMNGTVVQQSTPARGSDRPGVTRSRIPETPAPIPATPAGAGGNTRADGGGSEADELDTPPFLSGVSDPLRIPSKSQLNSILSSISTSLANTDADSWDVRMDALVRIERLCAGGTLRLHPPSVFVNALRTMPIREQIEDLRSQVTGGACRAVAAVAYELRGSGGSGDHFAPLAEMWIPPILKLSTSGVRLMAVQGERCILQLAAFAGPSGYPRLIPTFCDGCLNKTHHQNYKKCCVVALTVALRVWSSNANAVLERHLEKIAKAIVTAAENRDPAVREEGRGGFWALHARFPTVADAAMARMDVTSKKRLAKCRDASDADWDVGGSMHAAAILGHDVHSATASAGMVGSVGVAGGGRNGRRASSAAPSSRRGGAGVAPPGSTRKPRVARAGGASAAKVASTTVVPSGGGGGSVVRKSGIRRPGSAPGGSRRSVLPPPATPARGSSVGVPGAPSSTSRAGRPTPSSSSVAATPSRSTRKPWRRASAATAGVGGRGEVSVAVPSSTSRRPASERKLGRPASLTSAAAAAAGTPSMRARTVASTTDRTDGSQPPGTVGRTPGARRIGTVGGVGRAVGGTGRLRRRPATAPSPSSARAGEGDDDTGTGSTRRTVRAVDASSGLSEPDRSDMGAPGGVGSAMDVDVATGDEDGIDGKQMDTPPVSATPSPPTTTEGPLTLKTFLSSIDSDDWSARERGLSHLASSLSMCDDDATAVDAFTFAADASSQRSFVSALAKNIGDDNLPVAMAALEACHYSLMNATLAPVVTGHLERLLLRPILDRRREHPDPSDPVNCLVRDCLDAAGYVAPPPTDPQTSTTTPPIREEGEDEEAEEMERGASPPTSSAPPPLVAGGTPTASPIGQDVVAASTTLTTSNDGEEESYCPPPPSDDESSPETLESTSHDAVDEGGATPLATTTTAGAGNPFLDQSTQNEGATAQSPNKVNVPDPNNSKGGEDPSPSMRGGESSFPQESSEGATSNKECRNEVGSGPEGIHDRDDEKVSAIVLGAEGTPEQSVESVLSPAELTKETGAPDLLVRDDPSEEKTSPAMSDDADEEPIITETALREETFDVSDEQFDGKETGTHDQDTEKEESAATTCNVENATDVEGDPTTVEQLNGEGGSTQEDPRESDDHSKEEEASPTMLDAEPTAPQPTARHETPAEQSNEADTAAQSPEHQEKGDSQELPNAEGGVQKAEAQGETPFEAEIESKAAANDHQLTRGEGTAEVVIESETTSHDDSGREASTPDSVPSLEPLEQGEPPHCQDDEKSSPTEQNSKASMELSEPNDVSSEEAIKSEQPSHRVKEPAGKTPYVAQHSQKATQSETSNDKAEANVPNRECEEEDAPPSSLDANGRNPEQSGLKVEEVMNKAEAPLHDATEQLSPPTPDTIRADLEHPAQGESPLQATRKAGTPSRRHDDEENRNVPPSGVKGTKEVSFAHVEASSMRTPLAKINNGKKLDCSSQKKQLTPGFPKTPLTDPVLRYMTRPSPLTAVKLSKNRMDDMPKLIDKLSGDYPTQELYSAMQTLLLLARDKRQPEVWDRHFGDVLRCLLEGIERRPTRATNLLSDFNEDMEEPSSSSPVSIEDDSSESRHLYLQGLRVLVKYQPSHFEKVTGSVIEPLLRCSQDSNYFVVHTAERALENIVSKQDPIRCFDALLPNLAALADGGDDDDSLPVLLSMLRALVKLIRRVPGHALRDALPTLMACIVRSIANPSVDLRKASVLAMVELHYALGDDFTPHLNGLNDVQRRLVSFYIDRREASTKE